MLKEERRMFRCIGALSVKENHRVLRKAFREAVKAVREDDAKVAEGLTHKDSPSHDVYNRTCIGIAATIRRK